MESSSINLSSLHNYWGARPPPPPDPFPSYGTEMEGKNEYYPCTLWEITKTYKDTSNNVANYSGSEAPSRGFGSVLRLCVANNCVCVVMQDQFEPRSEFCSPKTRWRRDKILHYLSIVPYKSLKY